MQGTVLALLARPGHRVVVLQDATGSRLQEHHESPSRASAVRSGLLPRERELRVGRSKDDARFKQLSAIIKG